MSYNYVFYAGSPEESRKEILVHESFVSTQDFRRMGINAILEAAKRQRAQDVAFWTKHVNDPEHQGFARRMVTGRGATISVGSVFGEAVDILCADHGFTRLPVVAGSDFGMWDTAWPEPVAFGGGDWTTEGTHG